MLYEIIKKTDSFTGEGFIPAHAGPNDLELLNLFMEIQSAHDSKDEIDLLFSDKTAFAKAAVINTLSLVKERISIRNKNVRELDYCIQEKRSRIVDIDERLINTYLPDITTTKNELEKMVLGAESERREQYVSCWRDIMELRVNLMLGMRDYKANSRKKQLLEGRLVEKVQND